MTEAEADLRARVEQALRESPRLDFHEIEIRVQAAGVELRGAVDSALERRAARELVLDIAGVSAVTDHLAVKTHVRRSDAELVEAVRHALQRDAYVEGEIEVHAGSGAVRLDGSVPTYHARKAAEHAAWYTPGVTDVQNLLLVSDEEFEDVSPGQLVDA